MKAESQITESELEVMKILWEFGKATSSQIVERLTETTEWKPKTIQTLITRLVNKGAVGAEKINSKSFIYYPIVSEEQYKSCANKSFLQKLYNGSVNLMLASFVKEQKLSKKDLEFLKQLLDEEE
jgi:BlaI family penicillinase repressor